MNRFDRPPKNERELMHAYLHLESYKKFKRRHRIAHTLIFAFAVIMFWRGAWGILDAYLFPQYPFFSYVLSMVLAICILYMDDYHLSELE